ncbi:hypothetical protein SSKA14_2783 [Stenotrophomonas sp. SKA14]|nr:hypothetical protein SSKA14_2783 [Stenotrophomonas sp. SKA14]
MANPIDTLFTSRCDIREQKRIYAHLLPRTPSPPTAHECATFPIPPRDLRHDFLPDYVRLPGRLRKRQQVG